MALEGPKDGSDHERRDLVMLELVAERAHGWSRFWSLGAFSDCFSGRCLFEMGVNSERLAVKLSLIILVCGLWLSGCAEYHSYQAGELAKAQAETQNEITQLTRDYRLCLQSASGDLERQKGCAVTTGTHPA